MKWIVHKTHTPRVGVGVWGCFFSKKKEEKKKETKAIENAAYELNKKVECAWVNYVMKKSYQTSESAGVATNKELVHERPAHVSTIA